MPRANNSSVERSRRRAAASDGSHVVTSEGGARRSLGYVTSSYVSPSLGARSRSASSRAPRRASASRCRSTTRRPAQRNACASRRLGPRGDTPPCVSGPGSSASAGRRAHTTYRVAVRRRRPCALISGDLDAWSRPARARSALMRSRLPARTRGAWLATARCSSPLPLSVAGCWREGRRATADDDAGSRSTSKAPHAARADAGELRRSRRLALRRAALRGVPVRSPARRPASACTVEWARWRLAHLVRRGVSPSPACGRGGGRSPPDERDAALCVVRPSPNRFRVRR